MAKLNNNEVNKLLDEESGKETLKARIQEMKEEQIQPDFDNNDHFDADEVKEEENYKYMQDYLKTGNIKSLHVYKENEGDMDILLHGAIETGKLKFVKEAVENGADVNFYAKSYNGVPVAPSLVKAVYEVDRHNELRKEHEVDIYGKDISRETPEQITERRDIVKYLIGKGAKLEGVKAFRSPLWIAGRDNITTEILLEAGAPITNNEVHLALTSRDNKFFSSLIKHGYKPTAEDLRLFIKDFPGQYQKDSLDRLEEIVKANPNVVKEADVPEKPLMSLSLCSEFALFLKKHGANMEYANEDLKYRVQKLESLENIQKGSQKHSAQGQEETSIAQRTTSKSVSIQDLKNAKADLEK